MKNKWGDITIDPNRTMDISDPVFGKVSDKIRSRCGTFVCADWIIDINLRYELEDAFREQMEIGI